MKKRFILFLLVLLALQQNVFAAEKSYVVTPDNPVFKFNMTPIGYQQDEEISTTRTLTNNELHALLSAGEVWAKVLGVTPEKPANITLMVGDELNAFASSEYVDIGEDYTKTLLNVALNYETNESSSSDALVYIGAGLVEDHEGWEHFVEPYAVFNSNLPDLYSTIEHEIYHALGLASGAENKKFISEDEEKLTIWDSYLRVGEFDGTTFTEVATTDEYEQTIIADENDSNSVYQGYAPELDEDYFDIYNFAPYFVGEETMKVLSGIDGTVEECQEKIINAGGLLNYSHSYENPKIVYGLPINATEEGDAELSHIELRNSYMSHQNYQNWGILMEAELAALKDLGYENIELRDYFGKSYYLNNTSETWEGYENSGIGYGYWNGSSYDNSPSAITNGIGLHIYGDENNIRQEANILSNGLATIGVRIDGVGNTYTLSDGYSIETTGRNSIGLATMWGNGHTINLEQDSIIDASGENGIGLSFDFGKNIMGGYNDHRGSYIAWSSDSVEYKDEVTGETLGVGPLGDDMDLPEDLNGELVTELNIDGTVIADKAAIYISDNAHVKDINISETANIKGDIISHWNGKYSGANEAQVRPEETDPNTETDLNTYINFINNSSDVYEGFDGKILGYKYISTEGEEVDSTLQVNIQEGAVALKDDVSVETLHVDEGTTNPAKLVSSGTIVTNEVINEGAIEAQNGSYLFASSFSNEGEYESESGAKLLALDTTNEAEMNVGGVFQFAGNIQGDGNISLLSGGTLQSINDGVHSPYENHIVENTLLLNGGNLHLQNNVINKVELSETELNQDTNLTLDIDLATQKTDVIAFNDVSDLTINNDANINVTSVNVMNSNTALTDSEYQIELLKDEYNNTGLADNLNINIDEQKLITPIFKYNLGTSANNSSALFVNRGATGNVNSYNPAVLASPVAAQIGGYLTQLHTYDMAFGNMDMNMLMSYNERQAMKFRNKYAMSGVQAGNKLMTFSPNQIPEESRGMWFKPFATFEKVDLSNGPKVENQAYGSFFGGDTEIISLKKGWDAVFSGYAGYTGSHQHYTGSSIYQNGGTLGASGVFYKGNFFTGLTANIGASMAEASTMYGSEDITMLMTGIASKSGYNWELANNKFIIQPSWLMSYSFVNTFNYHNAAGVGIDADPLHAIQLVPGLKFIGNLSNGWQPYATIQMVWNLMDDTKFQANNVALPQMSVDPYVQYGVGVQKRWGDRFTGFGQTLIRNGGRNGVALSLGFRWAIGKN